MTDRDLSASEHELAAAYRAHLPTILRYLQRRLGEAVAEDAAADVFLRALRSSGPADGAGSLTLPWLYGIAANVIAERRRDEKRRLKTLQRLAAQRLAPSLEPAEAPRLSADLTRALLKLKPADRETLLLIAWGDLSYEQTAQALQIPLGTVRSRLVRARRQLDAAGPRRLHAEPPATARNAHV